MKSFTQFYNLFLLPLLLIIFSYIFFPIQSPMAQEITGVPGSPDATRTIDGKELPAPPLPFGGVIKENAARQTQVRIVPPERTGTYSHRDR
jgi:arylsulfatase